MNKLKYAYIILGLSLVINYITMPIAAPIIANDVKLHVAAMLNSASASIIATTDQGRKLDPSMPPPVDIAMLAESESGNRDEIAEILSKRP
jgi:hypothetical protein